MTKQSEALRLADVIERQDWEWSDVPKAAAEREACAVAAEKQARWIGYNAHAEAIAAAIRARGEK